MITINEYLDNILFDFKAHAMSGIDLCHLKKVHFDGGRIPDYSDLHVQQLYLLRYAYAYSFEYIQMYWSLIQRLRPASQITITSIGCGSMIDYWSLTRVVPRGCRIVYKGVDIVDWYYRMNGRPQDDVEFLHGDILNLVHSEPILFADAYVFPKSISEFRVSDINTICSKISEHTPIGKTVYFLFSLRTEDRSMARDMHMTQSVFQAMENYGFSSIDKCDVYNMLNEEYHGQKIANVDNNFHHPWEVVNFLTTELKECCATYCQNGCYCQADCEIRLKRWPILKCAQVRWQLFEFTKEG